MTALVLPIEHTDEIRALPLPEDPAERAEFLAEILGRDVEKLYLPGDRVMWASARDGSHPLINHNATPIALHYGAITDAECIAGGAVITSGDGRGNASALDDQQFGETLAELLTL